LAFAQYLGFYNDIYKLEDRPHNKVIENDKRLDEWIREREIEYKKTKADLEANRRSSSSTGKGSSMFSFDMMDMDDD
jgi:hypothetical protein